MKPAPATRADALWPLALTALATIAAGFVFIPALGAIIWRFLQ